MRASFTTLILIPFLALAAPAREPEAGSDRWLTNAGAVLPEKFAVATADTNRFATLRSEVVAGALLVKCEAGDPLTEPRLVASADAPGHWPARDWRSRPMQRRGASWVAELPVDSLDVPQIYFVIVREHEKSVASPMRLAEPRRLGLEQPTRLFWAFIEGFEQELESWGVTDPTGLRTDPVAKNGRASLVVRVPAGARSVSAQTTKLRGWFLQEHGAAGLGLWLRVKQGAGAAAFALTANASSTNQVVARRAETVPVSTNWVKAAFLFESFPKFPLGDTDLFTIEFVAEPGTELLLDDVHLLGRWRNDF